MYDVGRYDNPRNDFTLRIKDPFAQDNVDLMQPVIGQYVLKVIPSHLPNSNKKSRFDCEGLYFKQTGKYIYIDVRKLPIQERAGLFDLYVSLKIPGEEEIWNRLVRKIQYVDSAAEVVLVIDNSRSMEKNDPQGLRYSACENFVHIASLSNKIEKIAVVKFSGSAKVVLPWIATKDAKQKNIRRILSRSRKGNATNINEALEISSELFEDSVANDKIVILLTDGKNEPERYSDAHKSLIELGVKIYTVGLSKSADTKLLKEISRESEGEFFSAVDDEKLLRIYNQIAQEINDFKPMLAGQAKGEIVFPMVSQDEFVDINLYGYKKGTSFALTGPDGNEVALSKIFGNSEGGTSLFRLQSPKEGNYLLRASSKEATFNYNIHTLSDLFLKAFPLEKNFLRGQVIHFAASLALRDEAITGIPVTGKIFNSDGVFVDSVTLYDDGVHGDNHANDGVYCAIFPAQMNEGAYTIEYRAEAKDIKGRNFVRTDKQSFYILQADVENKDFFLASVLPLYIDLGEIQQGDSGTASIRLSFEGLENRVVHFELASPFLNRKTKKDIISEKALLMPDKRIMKPSEAEVISFKVNIPSDAPLGMFSSLVTIVLEDQEINIPIDFKVKKNKIVKQIAKRFGPTELSPINIDLGDLNEDPLKVENKKMEPAVFEKAEFKTPGPLAGPSVVVAKEIDMPQKKKEINLFAFDVSPQKDEKFEISLGQEAEAVYTIINKSSLSGIVNFHIEGYGEIGLENIEIEPGEEVDILWYWKALELDNNMPTTITFSSGNTLIERRLSWVVPPPKNRAALIFTLILLAGISIYYAGLYFYRSEKSDLYISASAALHFAVVLFAVMHLLDQPVIPEPEEEEMIVELLEPELEPEPKPEPELKPEPEPKPEPKLEKEPPNDLELPTPTLDVKPIPKNEEMAHQFEIPVDFKVEAQKTENDVTENQIETAKIELQEVESEVTSQDRSQWVMDSDFREDNKPVVLSVNDRPLYRATLSKRVVEEDESTDLKSELNEKNEKVERKGTYLASQKSDIEAKKLKIDGVANDRKAEEMEKSQIAKVNQKVSRKALKLDVDVAMTKVQLKNKIIEAEHAAKIARKKIKDEQEQLYKKGIGIKFSTDVYTAKNVGLAESKYIKQVDLAELKKAHVKRMKLKETKMKNTNAEFAKVETKSKTKSELIAQTMVTSHISEVDSSEKMLNRMNSQNSPQSRVVEMSEIKETTESGRSIAVKQAKIKERHYKAEMDAPQLKDVVSTKNDLFNVDEKVAGETEVVKREIKEVAAKVVKIELQKSELPERDKTQISITKKSIKTDSPTSMLTPTQRRTVVKQKNLVKRSSRMTARKTIESIRPADINLEE